MKPHSMWPIYITIWYLIRWHFQQSGYCCTQILYWSHLRHRNFALEKKTTARHNYNKIIALAFEQWGHAHQWSPAVICFTVVLQTDVDNIITLSKVRVPSNPISMSIRPWAYVKKTDVQTSPDLRCMLPVAWAQSSSGGLLAHYLCTHTYIFIYCSL